MSALEWIQSKRPVVNDELLAVQAGEFGAYDANRVTSLAVPVTLFVEWFGLTIEAALTAGESPVEALLDMPQSEARGWHPVFRLWKALGL